MLFTVVFVAGVLGVFPGLGQGLAGVGLAGVEPVDPAFAGVKPVDSALAGDEPADPKSMRTESLLDPMLDEDVPFALSKVFHLRDFGAIPNENVDASPAIRTAIAQAVAAGPGATVVFEPGQYVLEEPQSNQYFFEIRGAQDITVRGQDTELLVRRPDTGVFLVDNVQGATLQGFAIDYETPPFAQGTIVAVDQASGTFDFTVDAGYPTLDHPMFYTPIWGIVQDPGTALIKHGGGDHVFIEDISPVNERTFRLRVQDGYNVYGMTVGDRFVLVIRKATGVYVHGSTDVTIENVTIYTAPGAAFVSQRSDNTQLRFSKVMLKPGSDRALSTTADGFHHQQGRIGPTVENSLFEGMADDGINIYTVPNRLMEVRSERAIWVAAHGRIQADDVLDIFDPKSGCIRATVHAERVEATQHGYLIVLDRPVEGMVAGDDHWSADHIYNRSEMGSGFVIRNNVFRNHRRHGIYLKSQDGIVERNRFENLSGLAIVVQNEPDWPEGSLSSDLVLRDNVVDNVGYATDGYQSNGGAISIQSKKLGHGLAQCIGQQNIVIERNEIAHWPRYAVYIGAAQNVRLIDNVIGPGRSERDFSHRSAAVAVQHSHDVVVDGLILRRLRHGLRAVIEGQQSAVAWRGLQFIDTPDVPPFVGE